MANIGVSGNFQQAAFTRIVCIIVLAQVLFELNFASSFVCIMHGVERRAGSRDLAEKLPKQPRASSRNIGKENNCEANGALNKIALPF